MSQNGLFPVSLARHRNLYWQRFTSYDFARRLPVCPITAAEVLPAAASLPVVFREDDGQIEPISILSLRSDQQTPLVSEDGRWLGLYIPSQLRCYPFKAGPGHSASTGPVLLIDETSGLVTQDPKAEPFFTSAGQLTRDLCAVRTFLQECEAAMLETRRLCQKIASQGLFSPLHDFDGVPLPGNVLTIAPDRLSRLSQNQISTLMNSGALRLIHAHQVSMSHCSWLSKIQTRGSATNQISENLKGFIAAMGQDANQRILGSEIVHAES